MIAVSLRPNSNEFADTLLSGRNYNVIQLYSSRPQPIAVISRTIRQSVGMMIVMSSLAVERMTNKMHRIYGEVPMHWGGRGAAGGVS